MNPFLATDGYKTGHHLMYPQGTSLVYSNFTPRTNKYAPKGCDHVVSFGQQMVMKQIKEMFDEHFFFVNKINGEKRFGKNKICQEIKKEYSTYLNTDYDVSHIEALWDLGYLPITVKALPEGTLVPIGTPVLTIYNTLPEFYWLTNFLETLISNLLWKPITSATIAHQYKKNLISWAEKTDSKNKAFVEFQGHDFSMRGMDSINATISSGLGHATSFLGSDSLPVIHGARKYYDEKDFVVGSVNATEHSVMCAGGDQDELETFRYLMKQFPTGILSIVSDTWDLWKVCTKYLPELKEEILKRDGKIVIRPDSGDPVDIVCGNLNENIIEDTKYLKSEEDIVSYFEDCAWDYFDCGQGYSEDFVEKTIKIGSSYYDVEIQAEIGSSKQDIGDRLYYVERIEKITFTKLGISFENKGVIELLWETFGGKINKDGYKVLDAHIGCIYGDSITIDRAEEICKRLEAKGFASTNVVLGIGSFTYQYNTRDTFGFAMKATYVEVNNEGREIFKDPVTGDGSKKSAKGLLMVTKNDYKLIDGVSWDQEDEGALQLIFEDGKFYNETTLTEIRNKLNSQI